MQKKELVFLPVPGAGHIASILEFAKLLLERDQRLSATVLLINPPSGTATASYTQQVVASNPNIRFVDLPQVDPPPQELFLKSFEKYFAAFIEKYKPHVKDAIVNHVLSKSIPLAGLVVDLFCSSMVDVANELGVPSYVCFTSGAAFLSLMLYLPIHYGQTGREFIPSDPDSIIPAFVNPVPSRVLPSFLFNKDGGYDSFLYHATRFKETRGIFINTFAELEPHSIKFLTSDPEIPPIYTIGPLLNLDGQKKSESDSEKIIKWLDNQPPSSVVFLCFGSNGGFEPPQLAQIATALEQSEHRFIWSIRRPLWKNFPTMTGQYANFSEILPEGFLERTQNRGYVCGWAPQVEVLAHEAVGGFVSHCGWNSILESLWHGVPIATWPIYAEQQINAFHLVKELKLAVELKLDYRIEHSDKVVTADEIEKAIRCLMDTENPVRQKVKQMGEISRKSGMQGESSYISIGRFIEDILVDKL